MTPHHILAFCSRLAAIIWLLYALASIPLQLVRLERPAVDNHATVFAIAALQIAACAFLWLFPATVARKLLPLKENAIPPPARMVEWQTLGVVCVGLWGLLVAIPDTVYWVVVLQTWMRSEIGLSVLTTTQKARIAATMLELGLALWLVFGAKRIVGYIWRPTSPIR